MSRPTRINDDPPSAPFLEDLYGEDYTDFKELTDSEDEIDSDEYETPVLYSPQLSSRRSSDQRDGDDAAVNRSRSRSPLWSRQSNSPQRSPNTQPFMEDDPVILIVGNENTPALGDQEEFFDPDAHVLNARDDRMRSMPGRMTDARRGRGRGRPGLFLRDGRRHRVGGDQRFQWELGHPLQEVWTSDDDVPLELVQMAKEVVRKRQVMHERNSTGYEDPNDGSDIPLKKDALDFEWSPMETFQCKEEVFRPEAPTGAVGSFTNAYDAFRSFWDDNILQHIVNETNNYAKKISSGDFVNSWHETNIHEILMLFAFWMMIGIIRMPSIKSCFSLNPLLKTTIFRQMFTQTRYLQLVRALQFVDEDPVVHTASRSTVDPAASLDHTHRLRPIINHLNAKFQANYVPKKDICIDESLTLWEGRLNFKQYIRSKAAKIGIKTFELCESATGYLWSFIVYTGKQTSVELSQASGDLTSSAVVKKLIDPLLNKGYRLFMDNWFSSPVLARFLKLNGTDCVGTLRPSRKDVPYLVTRAPLERGQIVARNSGDVCVLAWQDKKRVTMLSTCHGNATALSSVPTNPVRPLVFKPQVVLDYNRGMGGVDLKDQMLEPYLLERKRGAKWYMKLFKRFLNCSILNARILMESSTKHSQDHFVFRLQLVESILNKHISHVPVCRVRTECLSHKHMDASRLKVNSSHWPAYITTDSGSVRNRQPRSRCFMCVREGNRNNTTPYKCGACNVPLCAVNCFKAYHS